MFPGKICLKMRAITKYQNRVTPAKNLLKRASEPARAGPVTVSA